MIISRNLIAEFLPEIKKYSLDEISNAFFKSGIEIERHEEIYPPTGLHYGKIKSFKKISGSDKLHLCQVEVPTKKFVFEIVCGAPNVAKNLNVVVALPGAVISNGKIKIQEREIFKVFSHGMLCSYSELYESKLLDKSRDSNQGIIELGENFDIGREFNSEDLGLDDIIFDLSVPANRKDLNCAWGLSQELCKNLRLQYLPIDTGRTSFDEENPWLLKRLLLTNNFECGDFFSNLNSFVYVAFNEAIDESRGLSIKKKSPFFSKLAFDFLKGLGINLENIRVFRSENLFSDGVNLDWDEIDQLLSLSSENKRMILNYLSKYGFGFSPDYSVVFPPEWRLDIASSRDFLEELLRFWTLDDISEEQPYLDIGAKDNDFVFARLSIRDFLISRNFMECSTFNLHRESHGGLSVSNPISNEHVALRRHALHELIDVIEKNYRKKNKLFPVFEIVEAFESGWTLNIVVPEKSGFFALNKTSVMNDLYDLQSLILRVFGYLNQDIKISKSNRSHDCFSEVNLLSIFKDDLQLGYLGFLKSDLPMNLWGCTVKLIWNSKKELNIPKVFGYPPSFKDISVEVPDNCQIGDVLKSIKADNLRSIDLIEKYEKDNLVSYLLRCKFQSISRTLNRSEVEAEMKCIYEQLMSMKINIR